MGKQISCIANNQIVPKNFPSIELQPVDSTNIQEILNLQVTAEQQRWIGPLEESINGSLERTPGYSYLPFAVYEGSHIVGFCMYTANATSPDLHFISGLLIDSRFQGHGYGRAALMALLKVILSNPLCRSITLMTFPENVTALALYKSLGFRYQGWEFEGEAVYSVSVDELSLSIAPALS